MNEFKLFIDAIKSGSIELFDKYYKNEYLEEKIGVFQGFPIHFACEEGQTEIVKSLIDKKCDIEVGDKINHRPIHLACQGGHTEIVKLLIDQKSDIEACNKYNRRPIHLACSQGHKEILKILIDQRCNIEACDENNKRPIHFACERGQTEIVKLLIDHKCNIDACEELWKQSPIHFACEKGYTEIVKILIEQKCNIEVCSQWNQRPIHFSCEKGYTNIVNLLIDHKCDIEARGQWNQRPIHFACWKGYTDILNLLIDQKCDIEASGGWGHWRPIHFACDKGHTEIVKILIQAGCDIEALTLKGESPMKLAKNKQQQEIIDILKGVKPERQLERLISIMGLKCQSGCDHKLCSQSIRSRTFQHGEIIGQGGFGTVFRCKGSNISRQFAIKYISQDKLDDSDTRYIENDINEYVDLLQHDHIIQYYGVVRKYEDLYIFMEYLPGGSLARRMRKENFLPVDEVIHYSKQMMKGLAFLHEKKIIHRDIKPENVLIDEKNNIKLADFGLGRLLTGSDGQTAHAETFCGTKQFMAPEIIKNKPYSFPADIYSLGATIYNMLTGNTPPPAKNLGEMIQVEVEPLVKTSIQKVFEIMVKNMVNRNILKRPTARELINSELFSSNNK